jgi:phi13 family phage major tail protein
LANSRIGAEQLTLSKLLTDVAAGSTTYDTPFGITKKLIKIGIKNGSTMEFQRADDQAVDVYADDGDVTIDIDITDLTEDEKALIFGQTMAAGVRTPSPSDVRPYFSVSWKSKKRSGAYKYYKLLKVMFKEPDEDFDTMPVPAKPQPDKISGVGIQRLSDGLRKRVADSESTSYVAATGTNWFTAGDITADAVAPTISSTLPAANAVSVVIAGFTFAWTFNKAILPCTVKSGNFFLISDVAMTIVAGTLSQNAAGTVITFTPTAPLTTGLVYKAVATSDVTDLSNNHYAGSVQKFTMA